MNAPNAAGALPPSRMKLRTWRPNRKGALVGHAAITLPNQLEISDIAIFSKDGSRWAQFPSEPMRDAEGQVIRDDRGKIKYRSALKWATRELQERFSHALIEAIEAEHGQDRRGRIMTPQLYMAVTTAAVSEQASPTGANVTPGPLSSTERVRRYRARKREMAAAAPIMYERADWQLFCRAETLAQQAGCEPDQIGRVVLKELVDNALDAGADATLGSASGGYIVADDGPGIDPVDIPRLFAVNRPLLSSKLKRLPIRGMLGNGLRVVMGAVAAFNGKIAVASRGQRLALALNTVTGLTEVTSIESIEPQAGTTVEIHLWKFDGSERVLAAQSRRGARV